VVHQCITQRDANPTVEEIKMTAVDILRPAARRYAALYNLAMVLSGSLFVALSAQVAAPLPFSPVPLTGQTLAALLVGVLLGSRLGVLALSVYLGEGLIGLPVFAGGGAGLVRLLGPTGGYLLGLVAAAFVLGTLAERGWDRCPATTLLAMTFGNLIIYAGGLFWLAHFVGTSRVVGLGLLPFIPGDCVKIVLAAALLPAGWKLVGRRSPGTSPL
jgi:biotin transport system substrate-specific component